MIGVVGVKVCVATDKKRHGESRFWSVQGLCTLSADSFAVNFRSQKLFISGCRTVACGDNQDDNKDEEDLEEHGDDTP